MLVGPGFEIGPAITILAPVETFITSFIKFLECNPISTYISKIWNARTFFKISYGVKSSFPIFFHLPCRIYRINRYGNNVWQISLSSNVT